MPKILILASISKAFYNFSFEFLQRMRERNWEVVISIPDDPINVEFEKIGCRVIPSSLNRHGMNPLAEIQLFFSYLALFRAIRPDAAFTFTIKPNTYGGAAARLSRVPYFSSVTGMGTVFYNPSLVHSVIVRMLQFGLGRAQTVFFQNQANFDIFQERRLLHSPVRMIPGSGVNLQKRRLLPYPESSSPVRFLMLARISREKGVAEYLTAAERIRSAHPDTEFHFAGFCEEQEFGRQLDDAARRGIVTHHGFLTNDKVETLMRDMHAVVLPSWHEGMSNVLLEGAAYGRPLITTDVPGCRETVERDVSGFLCAARSADSLTDALERFLALSQDAKRAMGLAGRRHVEARFDRELTIGAYLEELGKIGLK